MTIMTDDQIDSPSPLHCWMIKQKIHFPCLASLILCRRRRLPASSALSVERSDEVFTPAIETLLITYCLLMLPSRESSIFPLHKTYFYIRQQMLVHLRNTQAEVKSQQMMEVWKTTFSSIADRNTKNIFELMISAFMEVMTCAPALLKEKIFSLIFILICG